ncbi:MAG: hypothetical protein JW862_16875, partial [Anaerolineales bacterium]|nr:hypothetical protein [Anaerolineales bacterium]
MTSLRKILYLLIIVFSVGIFSILSAETALADGNEALGQSYNVVLNGDYAAGGVGLRSTGSGAINISNIPAGASVDQAFLYWAVMGSTSYTSPTLNGTPVSGTVIGVSGETCWGISSNVTYRADVTALVTGNGSYTIAGLPSGTPPAISSQGASLVVIYSDPGLPTKTVIIYDGAVSLEYQYESYVFNISGFTTTSPVSAADITFIVGDGQDFIDGPIIVNGTTIATDANFDGTSGNFWDVISYDIMPLSPANPTSVSIQANSDCLLLTGTVFSVSSPTPNTPPTANAGGPYSLATGSSLNLDGSGSSDPDQDTNTLTFAWDLDNNGSYETAGMTPLFDASALTPGVYTVGLQVTDDQSASDTDTTTVTVFTTNAFTSDGYSDGWVLERAETYNTGYQTDNKTKLLRIGDDRADRQYKTILSFDT